MFFLFFGTRVKRAVLGSGEFHCPYCSTQRQYEHVEARTWFHLFWIPLVPLGSAQESVQCTVCGGAWAPDVLQAGAALQDSRPTPQDTSPTASYPDQQPYA